MNKQKMINEYLSNVIRQKKWAGLALRDEKYAKAQAKRLFKLHDDISAQDFEHEAKVDKIWVNKRLGWAKQYEKKAERLKG